MNKVFHESLLENKKWLNEWYADKSKGALFPIYTSYDIRDSGFKICPVDANVFPAGFNNICATDKETSSHVMRGYIEKRYGNIKNVLLITEEHTKNLFYLENIFWLKKIIQDAGYEVKLTFAKELEEPMNLQSSMGNPVLIEPSVRKDHEVFVGDFKPDLIVSNNDFTVSYNEWMKDLSIPINPVYEMGWHRRRKNVFFEHYNEIVKEFSEIIKVDPWQFQVESDLLEQFSLTSEDSLTALAQKVDTLKQKLVEKYKEHNIQDEPYVYIKNASGTYGMGVTSVSSGEEVFKWNLKARKKMKASKGNTGVSSLIIQEGIPTTITEDEHTAEPAIYMIGNELAGGFLRVHKDKSAKESLNSPGAVFKRLCVSDLNVDDQGAELENVYGWIGKLGALAVAEESAEFTKSSNSIK